MSEHIDPALLEAFAIGDVGEHTATLVALHIDVCPHCANIARQADPLASWVAATPDPAVPPSLVHAILAQAEQPVAAQPWSELALGSALLATAAALAAQVHGLDAWWRQLVVLRDTLGTLATYASHHPQVLTSLGATAVIALVGSVVVSRAPSPAGRRRVS